MNRKIVCCLVFVILAAVSAAMLFSAGVSLLMRDPADQSARLAGCALLLFLVSTGIAWLSRPKNEAEKKAGMREGFAIVGASWLAATLWGMLPFIFVSGMHWYDAFFETASGFSTTGATLIDPNLELIGGKHLPNGIESLSYGILFWRSLTQWLGGMGIVVLSLAILPLMNIGGQMLYNAEVSGVKSMDSKIAPRIADSAKILWSVYILLTAVQIFLLRFGGMGWFDAVCHSFTTLATGGFSTKQASIAAWPGAYIQWVMIVFMFLSGCNFILHYHFLTRKKGQYLHDEEFRFYAFVTLFTTAVITLALIFTPGVKDTIANTTFFHHGLKSFRAAAFQTVSILTSTGFTTADYAAWPGAACVLLFICMFITACGGSTTGGMKCVRVQLMGKYAFSEIKRCIFPHMVQDIRINGVRYENATIQKTIGFCALYIVVFLLFAFALTAVSREMDITTALSSSLTCLSNVGPGFGKVGPCWTFSWMTAPAKLLLGVEMILGRLELYTLLVLFIPGFWRD